MTKSAKFPSFNWMRGVADNKRISIIHRLILLRILIHRQKDGECEPGYNLVAEELGVHRTTVIRAVDVAVRLGWLAPPMRGRRENARFVFTFPNQEVAAEATSKPDQEVAPQSNFLDDQEVAPDELRSRSKGVKKSLKKRASPTTSKASTQHGQRTGKERKNGQSKRASRSRANPPDFASPELALDPAPPSQSPTPEREPVAEERRKQEKNLDDAFARFWSVYPRKVNEDDARAALDKELGAGANIETVVARAAVYGVERAEAIRNGDDPQWTLYPATWLKKRKFNDPLPPGMVIDNTTGEPVVAPQPPQRQRQRPQTIEEVVEEKLAELEANGGDTWESWGRICH